MPKVIAKGTIFHDGAEYSEGDEFEVTAKQAEELDAAGAVIVKGKKQPPAKPDEQPAE